MKRNQTADLLKGLAVIFMIQVHIMELFAKQEIYDGIVGKISLFFGGPPCAPIFMAVMGYFLYSSTKKTSYYLKRACLLFLGGILLNIGLNFHLLYNIVFLDYDINPWTYIIGVDILPLAGMSIALIGILRIIFKRNHFLYLFLAVIITATYPYLPMFGKGYSFIAFINAFFWGTYEWSYFSLFPWFAYILMGYAFRLISDKANLPLKFSSNHSIVFLVPIIIFIAFSIHYAVSIAHNLQGIGGYYNHDILYFGWIIVFMAGYIMMADIIEVYSGKSSFVRYIKWIGKNVTVFYVFQWLIIGNVATSIYKTKDYYSLLAWLVDVIIAVSILTFGWEKLKSIIIKRKLNGGQHENTH
jgi:Heparan-alpha-glucosaminide N-acetyltransferase, catalytic